MEIKISCNKSLSHLVEKCRLRSSWQFIAALLMILMLIPDTAFAAGLTDLFDTYAFRGSWEIFSKMNWVGKIMSGTISAFSLLGLFTVGMRLMFTLLYLSGRTLWDNVNDIKSGGNKGMLGPVGAFKENLKGGNQAGLDSVIQFGLSLLPNIKYYSEYSDERDLKNLDPEDGVTSYLLKSALPYIAVITAFTMGFNGTLWQAYGTVVSGISKVAENFVDTRLDVIVDDLLHTGTNYSFGFAADNTGYGEFKQSVSKSIYNKVCAKSSSSLDTATKNVIGSNVENFVNEYIDFYCYSALGYLSSSGNTLKDENGEAIKISSNNAKREITIADVKSCLESGEGNALTQFQEAVRRNPLDDQDADNLEYSVVINTTPSYTNAQTIAASKLGLQNAKTGNEWYIHLFISKKQNSDDTNDFEIIEQQDNTKNSGTSSQIQTVTGDSDK